ncbi:MAG: phosphoadenosine phosphosulfate reductase family protein [Candidatus Levybacteria bacterium]|nr:phosphoadenosine phosphosulfate reductase family protein [Candidatus Levybacteria bacterium]
MKTLEEKIKKAKTVIIKAHKQFPHDKTIIAWTGGKDSTVLLHLVKETFGTIPFPVMFNDSTMEFEEIYTFINKITKEWDLNLTVVPHDKKELEIFHRTKDKAKQQELSRIMKVTAINSFVNAHTIQAFLAGIRWDEHEARSKETYFSKRDDHTRVHPILHFTESDIWDYIKSKNVPYVNLYDKGYRSLGEKPFTKKVKHGGSERDGREKTKEQLMKKLRSIGYW